MEWTDLLGRIGAVDERRIGFKRGLGDLQDVGRAICGFANSQGGVIVLGVDDSGTIVGINAEPERIQEQLSHFLESGCSAPVSARYGRHRDPSGWVHWIKVPQQRGYEPLRFSERVWVRHEHSSVEPSAAELQELYNAFGYILTETRAIQAAGGADIDPAAFRAYLRALELESEEEPRPVSDDDLRNRGVVTRVDGALHPTLYGTLAFGKEPQRFRHTANFWVECAAYAGRDRASDVSAVGEGKGRLDEQVQRAMGWVRGLGRTKSYSGLVRTDSRWIPEKALREAIVNAVAHRDYAITGSKVLLEVFSDRVDVTSPGLLPDYLTVESVMAGGRPRSRNELIANYLLVTGWMEPRGRGWPVIRRAMREFNGTDAELLQDVGGKFVRVTLRFGPDLVGAEK